MTMIQRLKNKKGFTLVELIVVIVIIAILAAVSVPMLTKYISNAKNSARIAAEDVVGTAAQAAAASVSGGLADNFVAELEALLPTGKYTVKLTNSTSVVVTLTGKAGRTVTITGESLDTKTPVISKVDASPKDNW